ncbi:serine/arginine repetitive matrix protein 1-like [Eptesicus fuscus]|uniref:serine/arginine repetitive matrix protein 1-like n=1 Tax=Eptesicus fuscus TaxID=29078 RepID=UPI0024047F01|nr:serine/arginine repetitive matrix protein 1-like [Eptesicus fuscus]
MPAIVVPLSVDYFFEPSEARCCFKGKEALKDCHLYTVSQVANSGAISTEAERERFKRGSSPPPPSRSAPRLTSPSPPPPRRGAASHVRALGCALAPERRKRELAPPPRGPPSPPLSLRGLRVLRAVATLSAGARASPRARCCPLAEAWEDAGEPLAWLWSPTSNPFSREVRCASPEARRGELTIDPLRSALLREAGRAALPCFCVFNILTPVAAEETEATGTPRPPPESGCWSAAHGFSRLNGVRGVQGTFYSDASGQSTLSPLERTSPSFGLQRPRLRRNGERMWWSTLMSILRASAQKCILDEYL